MRRVAWTSVLGGLAAVALLAGFAACVANPEEAEPEDPVTAPSPAPDHAIDRGEAGELAQIERGDGEPGEREASLANCVYVQFCNAKGYWGTVCLMRSGCVLNDAAVTECFADARAVCGAVVSPWWVGYKSPVGVSSGTDEPALTGW